MGKCQIIQDKTDVTELLQKEFRLLPFFEMNEQIAKKDGLLFVNLVI